MINTRTFAVRSLALALSLAILAPNAAHACGGYGVARLDPEQANAAVAIVQRYARALAQRSASRATASWEASGTVTVGNPMSCCSPPQPISSAHWISERIRDRRYRLSSIAAVRSSSPSSLTVTAVSDGEQGRWSETYVLRSIDGAWRIVSLYATPSSTARAK
jgi:hypothetical protein